MPDLSDLLGGLLGEGSVAKQFLVWNVLAAVASSSLTPFLTEVTSKVNSDHPSAPIDPGVLAQLVVRGLAGSAWAEGEAAKSGVPATDFALMVHNAGVGPSVADLLALHNRGTLTEAQLDEGLALAGVAPEWTTAVKALGITPPTPQEVMVALLQGQIEQSEAERRWNEGGGDPSWFQAAFDSEGSAPTPDELSDMANRGVIPWDGQGPSVVSFHQGFLEGPWRDKWEAPYRQLAVYIPPPETVTTMVAGGYLSDTDALKMYQATGMTAAVASAYLAHAHGEKTTDTKNLAVGEITTLYQDQAIDSDQASAMLGALGYSPEDAAFILTIQDVQRDRKFLESAISRIHTLYVGYKLDRNPALSALAALGVPDGQITNLFQTWDLERKADIKQLTQAEITSAWYYSVIDGDTALTKLQQLGFSPYDAWVILSLKNKGPLPDPPAETQLTTLT